MSTRYWLAVISREHIGWGIEGGFIQVCHGKQAPLKRMKKGDFLVVYSSKKTLQSAEKYQKFTAIGQILDDVVFQVQMFEDFYPFRRKIEYFDVQETEILPLIDQLEFIPNPKSWGYPLRFGLLEMSEKDFNLIASKMQLNGHI